VTKLETTYRPKNDGAFHRANAAARSALSLDQPRFDARSLTVGAGTSSTTSNVLASTQIEFPRTQLAIGGGTIGITPIEMARLCDVCQRRIPRRSKHPR
jgi:hypothetical protein